MTKISELAHELVGVAMKNEVAPLRKAQAVRDGVEELEEQNEKLIALLQNYRLLVGNTGYSVDAQWARELWELSMDLLYKSEVPT